MGSAKERQVGAQQERGAIEYPAWNNAYRNAAAIFIGFEPDDVGRKRIFGRQLQIQSAAIKAHTGLLFVEASQAVNPLTEMACTGDDFTSETEHVLPRPIRATAQPGSP